MIPPSSSNSEVQRRLDARDNPAAATVVQAVPEQERAPGTCAICPHPWHAHDPISARFCTATVAGGYSRGCVCPAKETG